MSNLLSRSETVCVRQSSPLLRSAGVAFRLILVVAAFAVSAYYFRDDLSDSGASHDFAAVHDMNETGNISLLPEKK